MPTVGFDDTTIKSSSIFDTDRLNLNTGEQCRIVLLDENATMEYVHYIKTGPIQEDGKQKGKYVVCLGDAKTLQDDGRDNLKCPACAVASYDRDAAVGLCRRRYIVNVARYGTNQRGDVIKPISLREVVWIFGDDKYSKLRDRHLEHGDLRKKDLRIKCTAKQYQQMDLDVAGQCIWTQDQVVKEQYVDLIKSKFNEQDLGRFLGTRQSFEQVERMVQEATPKIGATDIDDAISATYGEAVAKSTSVFDAVQVGDELPATSNIVSDFDDLLSST